MLKPPKLIAIVRHNDRPHTTTTVSIASMNFYLAVIAAASIFLSGWFGHKAYSAEELTNAIQEAQKKYSKLKAEQQLERETLERKIIADRRRADAKLEKALAENAQLRAEADALVSTELLVFARLCDDYDQCALLYGRAGADQKASGASAITAHKIYRLLSILDEQALETNLKIAQVNEQIESCSGR